MFLRDTQASRTHTFSHGLVMEYLFDRNADMPRLVAQEGSQGSVARDVA
jgi:hypothetical protein